MISHSRPTLGQEEIDAVSAVLKSGLIAQGKKVEEFEGRFAQFIGSRRAAAVNSGTAALHLALAAVGVRSGDEVIVPSFVCTALLNAINSAGGKAVITDIDEEDYNLSFGETKKRITPRSKAIILPHMFGVPSRDTMKFKELGVPLIEDCAQSVGATAGSRQTGATGDIGIFSFYATKVMTTGEGGMITTDAGVLADRAVDLRDYDNRDDYKPRYNYAMTDFQAAMGMEQLQKLPDFIAKRRILAKRYCESLRHLPVRLPTEDSAGIWFRYVIYTEKAKELIHFLQKQGIGAARPIFKPLHVLSGYPGDCPAAEKAWNSTVSLPIYPSLSLTDVDEITESVNRFFSATFLRR
jgi:perosamine synthetase